MLPHWGWCCFSLACSAMADFFVSPRLMAAWCSLRWVSRLLFVSPMYASPQLQGILYTTLDFSRVGSVFFTFVNCCRSVLIVVNTVLMSNFLQTLLEYIKEVGSLHNECILRQQLTKVKDTPLNSHSSVTPNPSATVTPQQRPGNSHRKLLETASEACYLSKLAWLHLRPCPPTWPGRVQDLTIEL